MSIESEREVIQSRKWYAGGNTWTLVAVVGIISFWMKRQLVPTHRYLPWHQTDHWVRYLKYYDNLAHRYFVDGGGDCESKMLATSFGQTHVYTCGSAKRPPIMFFHGAATNLLIYGSWIMPAFRKTHYSIAVDYPCDTGRSIPPGGDPSKCPKNEEEIADWTAQVLEKLGVTKPASMVGYSFGAFVSFTTARHKPQLVDKLVLLAPGGIFEDLNPIFFLRAYVSALFRSDWSYNSILRWLSADPDFDLFQSQSEHVEQLVMINRVGATILVVLPQLYSNEVLQQVLAKHKTFLGIGDMEVALKNATMAVERAKQAGAEVVKVYPNGGHFLMLPDFAAAISKDVVEFLNSE